MRIKPEYKRSGAIGTVGRVFPGGSVELTLDGEQMTHYAGHTFDILTDPAPRPEIMLDGHRYVLAPAAEAVAEVPEVKAGQVWRRDGLDDVFMVTKDRRAAWFESGIVSRDHLPDAWIQQHCTFIAPSLADALASGTLTADMLRGES